MKTLPLFLKTTGQRIAIVGGGEQATQKFRLARKTDANISIYTPTLSEELAEAHAAGKLDWVRRLPRYDDLKGCRIAFIALDCPGAGAAMASLAREAGAVVNMVDAPAWSDAYTPSIVDRDPIVIAIGTEGSAPMLGRRIRGHLEEMLPQGLGGFASYAGALRPRVAHHLAKAERMGFWRAFFTPGMRDTFIAGETEAVARWVDAALEAPSDHRAYPQRTKRVSFVVMPEAGAGAADLLSLRAARRLQETDLILHPHAANPALLDLARRDAERRPVHAALGRNTANPRALARLVAQELTRFDSLVVLVEDVKSAHETRTHLEEDAPGIQYSSVEILDAGRTADPDQDHLAVEPLDVGRSES